MIATSGSTATVLLHHQGHLYFAHVGDSRALIAGKEGLESGKPKLAFCTRDHKPTLIDEQARITAAGGEVRKLPYESVHRVYCQDANYPGLAMSRAFGDSIARQCGVISEPEISVLQDVGTAGACIVLASDGLWEFTRNKEVIEALRTIEKGSEQRIVCTLADQAVDKWLRNTRCVVDDITVIVYHF
jgi:serine/threonine protein phosphatase PrpC